MNIKKYKIKRNQILSIIFYLIIQSISLLTPYVLGLIIDNYIPNKNINAIIIGIIIFVSIPFISVILQTLYNYITIKHIRIKGNEIAIDIMRNLIYQDKKFFDSENSLELLSYCSKEIVNYIYFYICDLAKIVVNIVLSIGIFAILSFINPILALIQLLYIPLCYFPIKLMTKNINKEVSLVLEKNAVINQIKGDTFKAIDFVKLNRLEEKKVEEVKKNNNIINKIWGKVAALESLTSVWSTGFVTVLFTGITFGIGALLILNTNSLQVGSLVSIITYCGLLYSYINYMLQTNVNKKQKDAEFSKALEYLNLKGEFEENRNKKSLRFENNIIFKNCNFSYDKENVILNNFNIEIKKGIWTGIIGESGIGKSTMFDLIMKLYKVDDNQIFIDNIDINQINSFDIRDNITKVTQDVYLFPGSILDNLKLIKNNIIDDEVDKLLEFVCLDKYVLTLPNGINTDVGEAGKLMSGGEKQRLSLALGLLRNNKILLLDEITSNLDSETENKIKDNLLKLINKGYTIISISHNDNFLSYANIIYEIKKNEVIKIK